MTRDTKRWLGPGVTVRAACPTCGTIEMRARDITILPRVEAIANVYRFCCPQCATWIVREATPCIVMLLLRAGVRVAYWHEPGGVDDSSFVGITDDELREFQQLLAQMPTTEI